MFYVVTDRDIPLPIVLVACGLYYRQTGVKPATHAGKNLPFSVLLNVSCCTEAFFSPDMLLSLGKSSYAGAVIVFVYTTEIDSVSWYDLPSQSRGMGWMLWVGAMPLSGGILWYSIKHIPRVQKNWKKWEKKQLASTLVKLNCNNSSWLVWRERFRICHIIIITILIFKKKYFNNLCYCLKNILFTILKFNAKFTLKAINIYGMLSTHTSSAGAEQNVIRLSLLIKFSFWMECQQYLHYQLFFPPLFPWTSLAKNCKFIMEMHV